MNLRLDIIRVYGVWTLTDSGAGRRTFPNDNQAIQSGIAAACKHRADGLGDATVHVWRMGREETIFDTRLAANQDRS